jgi:hypothetical protein
MFRDFFVLILLGHVIGDFYLQSKRIAQQKEKSYAWLLLHGGLYAVAMFAVCIPFMTAELAIAATVASVLHLLIDVIKHIVLSIFSKNSKKTQSVERSAFFIDQLIHLISILVIVNFLAAGTSGIRSWEFLSDFAGRIGILIHVLLSYLLSFLLLHKPSNIAIQKLLTPFRPEAEADEKSNHAGRLIGTIERIIMFILIALGQFAAIGLVLTAKSIARYDRISKEKDFAEYYLLGTLVSTLIVIVISFMI